MVDASLFYLRCGVLCSPLNRRLVAFARPGRPHVDDGSGAEFDEDDARENERANVVVVVVFRLSTSEREKKN